MRLGPRRCTDEKSLVRILLKSRVVRGRNMCSGRTQVKFACLMRGAPGEFADVSTEELLRELAEMGVRIELIRRPRNHA
jgi:hypothetical protein